MDALLGCVVDANNVPLVIRTVRFDYLTVRGLSDELLSSRSDESLAQLGML